MPVNCYNVSCTFVNTTVTSHPDFLRPNGNKTPEVMRGIGRNYSTDIGVNEPNFGSPATTTGQDYQSIATHQLCVSGVRPYWMS